MNSDVFIVRTEPTYPEFPYSQNDGLAGALRLLFTMWGKDPRNPFEDCLRSGDLVVIKPNWVHHENLNEEGLDALVTHTSLIKHLIDFLAVALKGRGSIVIGDAPIQGCNFPVLLKRMRVTEMVEEARKRHAGLEIRFEDWRLTVLDTMNAAQRANGEYGKVIASDYELVDLGAASFLEEIADCADRFRVTCYSPDLMTKHHQQGKHEYLVTRRVFDAALVINLAKMKTHAKAGLTGALKNVVGINGHKEFLPHHIRGSSESGGDCYFKRNSLRDVYDIAYQTGSGIDMRSCLSLVGGLA